MPIGDPEPPANDPVTGSPPEPSTSTPSGEPSDDIERLNKALDNERRLRREAEAWRKEHEPTVTEHRARADKDKSDSQKLAEALEAEKAGRSAAEQKLMRFEVATAKGVPANLVRFLNGSNKEELEEAADALLKELGTTPANGKPSMPERPRERSATGQPSNDDETLSPAELAARVLD